MIGICINEKYEFYIYKIYLYLLGDGICIGLKFYFFVDKFENRICYICGIYIICIYILIGWIFSFSECQVKLDLDEYFLKDILGGGFYIVFIVIGVGIGLFIEINVLYVQLFLKGSSVQRINRFINLVRQGVGKKIKFRYLDNQFVICY